MNPKISITQTLFGAKTWRSCLQLLVALAILCGGSMARAQFQSDTWVGGAAGSTNTWTTINNWSVGGNLAKGMTTNGDALTFGPSTTMNPNNNFPTVATNTTAHTTNLFGIFSITFSTNGYALSGNALMITNGITDNFGQNSESIPLTLGKPQTFANFSSLIGTNASVFTNTESGTIDLKTNPLTIGGSAPFFLTGAISSTNSGNLIVNNSGITRLGAANSFGLNTVVVTSSYIPYGTNITTNIDLTTTTNIINTITATNFTYYTNVLVLITNGVSTNLVFFYVTNTAITTFSNAVFATNLLGPKNVDVVWHQGGILQLNNGAGIPGGANVGNLKLDGTLDLNAQSPTINGLEDSGLYSGVVDNISTANTGTYTLTLGNANSNGVFSGVIQNTAGTVALTKTGYGKETLQNINTYNGPTFLNQGTIVVVSGATLGINSTTLTIASGAVLDVSGLNPGGYVPYGAGALTVAAGTPVKPYTNFVGFDPSWGTDPTNYVVSITGTNSVLTFLTNLVVGVSTNIFATTNYTTVNYSTNSIVSIVNADVVGNFTVNGGGAISPITSISPGIATWAIQGNLTLDSSFVGALNRVNFLLNNTTGTGGGTNDLIAVSGTLAIGDELDFVITPLTGTLASGDYTLMTSAHYVGTSPNNGHAAVLKLIESRGLVGDTIAPVGNNIVLHSIGGTATPGNIFWAGTPAANNWDVHLTQNWKFNGTNDYFYAGDDVTFDDTGNGTVVLPVVVAPRSVTFNNNRTNYTFAQNASTFITGPAGLTMNGRGTVTLQNPNSFTGDITLNNGTLNLGYHSTASPQFVLYNGVPAGNLVMGGGSINQNALATVAPFAPFQNLIINPGASTISQSGRASTASPRYFFTNNLVRAVGGVLDLEPANGNNCGIYFLNTNSPGGTTYYGTNGILSGFATIFLNDWVRAASSGGAGVVAVAFGGYLTDNNPANWRAASNVVVTAAVPGITSQTINSLKIVNTAPMTVNINPGNALTLWSGGLLVPNAATPFSVTIAGGTLLGATNADLVLLNNNGTPGATLIINSVIADNTNALATQGSGLTSAGDGTTILAGNNTYSGPTYIDNGFNSGPAGTLQIGNGGASGSIASSSAVIDNGILAFNRSDNTSVSGVISGIGNLTKLSAGALTLTANSTLSGQVTISAGTLQLGNGGASGSVSNTTQIVDNGTLVFNNNNTVSYPKVISGFGDVVQFGTGNLIIATNETYGGNTIVSNGTMTLTASGSISNTISIAVNSRATLDVSALASGLVLRNVTPTEVLTGSGTINGSVTTASGTTVEPTPSTGAYGTLTISGNFTMSGGAFRFDVGNGNGNHDFINVGGTLTENLGTIVVSVTGGTLNNGVYPLIHASGGLPGGSVTNLAIYGFNQPGQIAQLIHDPSQKNLDLLVSGGNNSAFTWVGDGANNIWDLNTTPNWNNGSGPSAFANNSYTTFDDNGSAGPSVNITAIVSPLSISNNAVAKNYTLGANTGSAGKITGGASLTQNGANQLTLQTVNDYLGGTVINAGTVQLGNNTAAAEDGMVGGNGAVVIGAAGSLVVSNFATETLSGPLSGSGQLVQQGNGKLVLTGNNSAFAGPISVSTNGSGTNVILQMGNGYTGTLGTGTVTNNRTLLFNVGPTPSSLVPVNANITGGGNVTNIGPGVVLLNGTNTYTGRTVIPNGTLRVGSSGALPPGTGLFMDANIAPGSVGQLDLNGYDVTVASLAGNNTGNGNVALVEPLIYNNGSTTNTLTINGGTASTFNGEILDNNNGGTGKLALKVINGSALTLNACYNNLTVVTLPSLFSGGIIISNASLFAGVNAGVNLNLGLSANGIGTITLMGGHGAEINGATRAPTNGMFYCFGNQGSSTPTMSSAVSLINIPTGESGTIFGPMRGGAFTTSLTGGGTVTISCEYVREQMNIGDAGFTGTIILAGLNVGGSAGGNFPLNNAAGWPNADVILMTNNPASQVQVCGTVGGNVLQWGSLSGGDSTIALCGGTNPGSEGSANTIYAIGSKNVNTTNIFGAQFLDGGVGIRKVGIGTWILTNNVLSYGGQTVVSNGTMAFAPLGQVITSIITNLDLTTTTNFAPVNYPLNNNYLIGSNITIVASGILDLSQVGSNTLYLGHNGAQTLFGNGTLKANLTVTNSVVAPGRRASDTGNYPGNLKVSGTAKFGLGSTFRMAFTRTAPVTGGLTNDTITATGGLTINSAAFIAVNAGDTAFAPLSTNVFQFFSGAVAVNLGGTSGGITNISVPTNFPVGVFWLTNLDGTRTDIPAGSMAIANINTNTVNASPSPVQVSVSGNQLTLGWPTNLGWILQAQTNSASIGLSNNWVDVAGSALVTNVVITINPNSPSVFYRLRSPP